MANSAASGSRLPCLGLMIAPSWPAAIAFRTPAVEGLARYSTSGRPVLDGHGTPGRLRLGDDVPPQLALQAAHRLTTSTHLRSLVAKLCYATKVSSAIDVRNRVAV